MLVQTLQNKHSFELRQFLIFFAFGKPESHLKAGKHFIIRKNNGRSD